MKKFYSTVALMAMMVASLCMVSCGNDGESNSNEPDIDPTPTTPTSTTFADTISLNVSIPAEVKEMLQLHYYIVEDGVEREVESIPVVKKIFSEPGVHSYGCKITTDIKCGADETSDAFSTRLENTIADYAAKHNITDYNAYDFKIKYYCYCNDSQNTYSVTNITIKTVADYVSRYHMTYLEPKDAFITAAVNCWSSLTYLYPSFAYEFTVNSNKTSGSRTEYKWKNY